MPRCQFLSSDVKMVKLRHRYYTGSSGPVGELQTGLRVTYLFFVFSYSENAGGQNVVSRFSSAVVNFLTFALWEVTRGFGEKNVCPAYWPSLADTFSVGFSKFFRQIIELTDVWGSAFTDFNHIVTLDFCGPPLAQTPVLSPSGANRHVETFNRPSCHAHFLGVFGVRKFRETKRCIAFFGCSCQFLSFGGQHGQSSP